MIDIITTLKFLYITTHPLHAQRAATLEPLVRRAWAAVAAHAAYQHDYNIRQLAGLDLTRLQRRVRRDLFPVLVKAVTAATLIRDRGTAKDVVVAIEGAEAAVDGALRDREFDLHIQILQRDV